MKTVTLREITLNITDGKHGDCEPAENSGYYFVSCKDVNNGTIDYANARQISERAFLETHKRTQLEPNDILITNSGTIGRMALVKDIPETYRTTFQKSVAIVKPDISVVLPTYLYYKLQNCVTDFVNCSNGSAQKNLLLGTMRKFQIDLHEDFAEQERLSSILAAYDNLIENNQKQIKLLEEAARRLYKEWFVDLRFPGYEDTPIVDGVPEGWEEAPIDSRISLLSGYAFKSAQFDSSGEYKIVTIKNVKDGEFDGINTNRIVSIPGKTPKHCVLTDGDILLSLTGNVGRTCIVNGNNYLLNQCVAKLQSDIQAFTYCLFRSSDMFDAMNNLANGTAQQNLSPIRTGKISILFPADNLLEEFERIVGSMISKMLSLIKQCDLLIQARDRLLPKLISGEIEV